MEKTRAHLKGGAKRAIISAHYVDAPCKWWEWTMRNKIISLRLAVMHSVLPTTWLLWPTLALWKDSCMTTVHAIIATQKIVDGPSGKLWCRHDTSKTSFLLPLVLLRQGHTKAEWEAHRNDCVLSPYLLWICSDTWRNLPYMMVVTRKWRSKHQKDSWRASWATQKTRLFPMTLKFFYLWCWPWYCSQRPFYQAHFLVYQWVWW